ncbi:MULTISPECIES: triacylglycerol lipase [unclassified Candidatus Cardinium]|uniref:esterase/lipase family protein n=1 Tax=unclassified Candidatus Cardinium TaxID=2641185 RepID=UPI001FB261C5|nr:MULTISPECIES: alpha/beta hydrolase [unclassified Candidatus Cardinium]
MYPTTGLYQCFIWIYRFSLVFCFSLIVSCSGKSCSDKHKKNELSTAVEPRILDPPVLKEHTAQQNNKSKRTDEQNLDVSDELEISRKGAKNIKRLAKVTEDKQAIVLLHGLARISSDFNAMIAILEKRFPHATIVALKSVNKDSNNQKSASLSSKLSIKQQARLAYEEIKAKIPFGSHLILVGHSQGGLRALVVAKEYEARLKRECAITIEQLITIGTPWKGAPIFQHIKRAKTFNEKFGKIAITLDKIQPNYSKAVRGYFFKKAPELAKHHPNFYGKAAPFLMKFSQIDGIADLDPESDFIRNDVVSSLKEVDWPITAIAGVLTDFSELFDTFQYPISAKALTELNATYAELIGGNPNSEHDMLLPVATQHAEGLGTRNFKRIKVYGTCHGNKVGVSVKRGLSELNNKAVIEKVTESIEETFYEYKEEKEEVVVEQGVEAAPAA